MPKFEITLRETEIYVIDEVEADTEYEAFEKAVSLIESDEGKQTYHNDSDGDYEAVEI